jgi:hypothetical protein
MTVFGGKGEGKVHPSRHIFIFNNNWGKDYMDNVEKEDIGIDCLLFKHILLSYKCTIRLETSYINLVYPLYTIMLYT